MKTSFIRRQLESHLNAWVSQQAVKPPVAWQNVAFTPPTAGVWLEVALIPADTVSGSLDTGEWKGLFRVNVYGQVGKGSNEVEAVAEAIARHFPAGADLSGVNVPRPPSVGRGDSDEGLFMVPISIRYRLNAH